MKGVREAFGRITSVVLLLVSLGLLVALPRWRADLLSSDRPSYSIERGRILVARPLVRSKTFSRTTIVLLEHDATRGTSGVILNRPPDSELDPPVHDGGPVNREGIVGLVVGDPAPAGAETVLPGLHRVSLETALALRHTDPGRVRLFRGTADWSPGQLAAEVRRDGWDILPGEASRIFEKNGEEAWLGELTRAIELGVGGPRDAIERSSWAREGLEEALERHEPPAPPGDER